MSFEWRTQPGRRAHAFAVIQGRTFSFSLCRRWLGEDSAPARDELDRCAVCAEKVQRLSRKGKAA